MIWTLAGVFTGMDVLARIQELEDWLGKARRAYYNGMPVASDDLYDARRDELAELKSDSAEVTAIGAPVVSSWPKVAHTIPMGSLDKAQTLDEITTWINGVSRPRQSRTGPAEELLVTEKLDGISVSVRYEEGNLVQALTRGDGHIGEDVTPNVARMKGIFRTLPKPLTITFRGEIVVYKADHEEFFPGQSSTRNTASGTTKRLDGRGCEHLSVLFYQALDGPDFLKEAEQFEFMKGLGLLVPNWYVSALAPGIRTPHDLWVEYQQSIREQLPYEIDGLVVRVNDIAHQLSLGDNHGRPNGAVAFKFAAITRETISTGREDNVGGTGRITPVAIFKPIRILGAQISRASLYNQRYIELLGWDVGSKILVSRANDVIPRVVSVTGSTGTVSQPPTHCPACGAETARDGEYIVCPNTSECPAQVEGRIKQWVHELNILEWGEVLIQKVVEAGLAKSIPGLYRLTEEQLAALDRMGPSSAKKAREQLWKVVPLPLEQFLGALGIPLCATSTLQTVVDAGYDTLDKILSASREQLQNIPGMGPKRAESLYGWLQRNGQLVEDLLDAGVTLKEKIQGVLTGKSVCFTGKSTRKRAELEQMVTAAGGSVKKSVGKGLTYLVLADANSTSTKATAARKLGTECLSEEDFVKLVGAA